MDGDDLGGGFKYFLISTPNWGNDPIWRSYFSGGWFNHQLVMDGIFGQEINQIKARLVGLYRDEKRTQLYRDYIKPL